VEEFQFIDIMSGSAPGAGSRWDNAGNADGVIRTLDTALTKAGVPGQLQSALGLLDRCEEFVAAGRVKRDEARQRLEQANRKLLEDVDVDAYVAALRDCEPWISDDSPASAALGDAARQTRVRAVMVTFSLASTLYRRLSDHCADVVASIASIAAPPDDVWGVQTIGEASTLMIRAGRESDWAHFVRLGGEEWSAIMAAAKLLRETGQFGADLHFPDGAPANIAGTFLNWQAAAAGLEPLKLLPGPLRIRRAHDLGWRPGLWLASDHRAAAEKPKRGLLAGLVGSRA
jgi:hypothetical protein